MAELLPHFYVGVMVPRETPDRQLNPGLRARAAQDRCRYRLNGLSGTPECGRPWADPIHLQPGDKGARDAASEASVARAATG